MEHRRATELLAALDSGDLDLDDRRELLEHVSECSECSDWLATYRLVSEALAGERPRGAHPASDRLAQHAVDPSRLADAERAMLGEHLSRCPSCRRELELTLAALERARDDRTAARRLLAAGGTPLRWAAAAAVILAVVLAFVFRPQPRDRALAGVQLGGTQVIEAKGSITAGTSSVESGGDVTFRAGETVTLSDGFSVGPGATFKVVAGRAVAGRVVAGPEPAPKPPPARSGEII